MDISALTASLVKCAATLHGGGSRYHNWVGVSAIDQAKSSPPADQISAVPCSRAKVMPTAGMVSTTVGGAESSGRQRCSVASADAEAIQPSSIQASPVTVRE